jgi:uncharacterized protein (TIGR03437 family)
MILQFLTQGESPEGLRRMAGVVHFCTRTQQLLAMASLIFRRLSQNFLWLILISSLSFAQSATLSLASGSAIAGGAVSLNLNLAGGAQPAGLQWTFTYSAADFTAVSVVASSSSTAAGKSVSCNGGSGSYTCLLTGINTNTLSDSTVATATFTLASGGNTTRVVQLSGMATDLNGSLIPETTVNGTVTALPPVITPSQVVCSPSNVIAPGTSSCTVTISAVAPAGGLAVATSSNQPSVTVPNSITVAAGATSATFTASVGSLTSNGTAVLTASANGGSATASLGLTAPPLVSSLSCNPATATSGGSSACTVTLNKAALAGGTAVSLSSNNSILTVPASVTIAAGTATGSFTAAAGTIVSTQTAVVTATLNGSSKSASFSLLPPITVSSVACAPTSLPSGGSSTCTVMLSASAPAGGLPVALSANSTLLTTPASVIVAASARTVTFTATAAATIPTAQTVIVTAALNGSSTTAFVSLTPTQTCPCFIWSSNAAPTTLSDPSTSGAELGMRFRSRTAGYVVGVRFYKGPKNIGTHTGHVWSNAGKLLASVTFKNETAAGWQQAIFAKPIAVTANSTYLISYHAPRGGFSRDASYFSGYIAMGAVDVYGGPVYALRDGEDGINGPYKYGTAAFPTLSNQASNYWVDVIFNTVPSTTPTTLPASSPMSVPSETTSARMDRAVPMSMSASKERGSLSCAPNAVRAGESFKCELQPGAADASYAVKASSSDVRVPKTVAGRPGQRAITFRGTVEDTAPQSVVVIAAVSGSSQLEDRITVLPSAAPIAGAPETLLVKTGEPINFMVSTTEPASLPVQITATGLPAGASFNPAANRFEWTPAPNQHGEFTVTFTAANSAGYAGKAQTRITVSSARPVLEKSSRVACSPGSLATLNGNWLTEEDLEEADPTGFSLELSASRVRVNGALTPLVYASQTRVDFQCPNVPAGSPLSITLETPSGTSAAVQTTMLEATPTLLRAQGANDSQGAITIAGTDRLATERDFLDAGEPVHADDVVSIRATGVVSDSQAAGLFVKIGDIDAQILSVAPAPDAAGVVIISARIPAGASLGGAIPVRLEMIAFGGQRLSSNAVTLAIE